MESKLERLQTNSAQLETTPESALAELKPNGLDAERKPMKFFVDFENVHGAGLKGIVDLNENDEVLIFYSQAAETFHIEQAIDLLNSKARIRFIEVDAGTRNALDFQLVAALFGTMEEGYEYAIVSGDGGYDAAVKMGKRLELPDLRRITDLTGSTEAPQAKPRRSRSRRKQADDSAGQETPSAKLAKEAKSDAHSAKPGKNGQGAQAARVDEKPEPASETKLADADERTDQVQASSEGETSNDGKQAEQKQNREGGRRRRRSRAKHKIEEQPAQAQELSAVPQKLPAGQERRGLPAPAEETEKATQPVSAPEESSVSEAATQSAPEAKDDSAKAGKQVDRAVQPTQVPETASAEPVSESAAEAEAEPARSGRYSKRREVKALLAANGIELSQQQLASVMKSLNGVKNKREFYNRIIKEEKQQAGRELYHQVREYYEAMVLILHG